MRIDWYTKGVLTVIAALPAAIALRPYVSPYAVQAQGSFAGVQFTGGPNNNLSFFDPKTGDVWGYFQNEPNGHYGLAKLGGPLVK